MLTSMRRLLILDAQATTIKVELEPSQLAKVVLYPTGFHLAVKYVGMERGVDRSLVRKCTSLTHPIRTNRYGVIALNT